MRAELFADDELLVESGQLPDGTVIESEANCVHLETVGFRDRHQIKHHPPQAQSSAVAQDSSPEKAPRRGGVFILRCFNTADTIKMNAE
jgi:hypothetical protein